MSARWRRARAMAPRSGLLKPGRKRDRRISLARKVRNISATSTANSRLRFRSSPGLHQLKTLARDFPLFFGVDHEHLQFGQKSKLLSYFLTERSGVFAYTAGVHQGVRSAQHRQHRTNFANQTVDID